MKKIIVNIDIFTGDEIIKDGFIKIDNSIISEIGTGQYQADGHDIVDLGEKEILAIPGLINSHTHSGMAALKGAGDDLPFEQWLFEKIIPLEDKLDEEMIYLSAIISQMEMARNGITSFVDMYMMLDSLVKAVREFGMRAWVCRGLVDKDTDESGRLKQNIQAYNRYNGLENGRITIGFGPHSPYMCSHEYLKKIADVARDFDALIHIHLKESSNERDMYSYRELSKFGLFDTKTIAAHCVYADDDDIAILKDYDVAVAHNPSSNLKLANGIAPIEKMLARAVNVCLGTDSVSSNNSLDIFKEMLLASLIHKGKTHNPECIRAELSFKMATSNAAKALGRVDIGTLRKGAKADIAFVDTQNINLFPFINPISNLVYSGRGSDVVATMVDGEFVYYFGKYPRIDETAVRKEFIEKFVKLYQ